MQLPEALRLPPVAQAVIAISAVALAIVRLLTASRPFWASTPPWAQKIFPAILMAIAAIPTAIEHARSWLDVVVAVVVSGAMFWTASRGDRRPPEDSDGGPRLHRTKTDPKVDDTVSIVPERAAPPPPPDRSRLHNDEPAECRGGKWFHPDWRLALCCSLLLLPGCASWKPVARTVADVAKDLCVMHFGAKSKLSPEEIARQFCKTRDDLEPWVDALLEAKQGAAAKAEAAHP